jgi:hypothetical protein
MRLVKTLVKEPKHLYKEILTQAELDALLSTQSVRIGSVDKIQSDSAKQDSFSGASAGDDGRIQLQRIMQELRETRVRVEALTQRVQMLEQLVVQKGLLPRIELNRFMAGNAVMAQRANAQKAVLDAVAWGADNADGADNAGGIDDGGLPSRRAARQRPIFHSHRKTASGKNSDSATWYAADRREAPAMSGPGTIAAIRGEAAVYRGSSGLLLPQDAVHQENIQRGSTDIVQTRTERHKEQKKSIVRKLFS